MLRAMYDVAAGVQSFHDGEAVLYVGEDPSLQSNSLLQLPAAE